MIKSFKKPKSGTKKIEKDKAAKEENIRSKEFILPTANFSSLYRETATGN
jgi:hypothetical protein